jgi:hypothetical protein
MSRRLFVCAKSRAVCLDAVDGVHRLTAVLNFARSQTILRTRVPVAAGFSPRTLYTKIRTPSKLSALSFSGSTSARLAFRTIPHEMRTDKHCGVSASNPRGAECHGVCRQELSKPVSPAFGRDRRPGLPLGRESIPVLGPSCS